MKLPDTSSGDPLADKRADFAAMLFASGDPAAAADLLLQALERAPRWSYGWFRLGEMQEAAGVPAAAIEAYRMAAEIDPADRAGARLKLHLLGAAGDPGAMPPAFVETLFDQYAGTFEDSLLGKLDYRVPTLLGDAIAAAATGRFSCGVDLGCGTGLLGVGLRPVCDRLEGYDISSAMLAIARGKGVYDHLEQADLATLVFDRPRADLAAAADVFMYLGALDTVFRNVAAMLVPGGLFAFSVERLDAADGFALGETRRYAHSRTYVEAMLARVGLEPVSIGQAVIRTDRERPVEGLLVMARKP